MGKRYIYWRTPDGKPYYGSDRKHAPVATLAALGETASVNAGRITYHLSDLPEKHHLVLRSAVVVLDPDGNELSPTDTRAIINQAISSAILDAGGKKAILPETFCTLANGLAAKFFRQPLVDFLYATTLSVASFPTESIVIDNCKISDLANQPFRLQYPKSLGDYTTDGRFNRHIESTQYRRVVVETSGRTASEAESKASDVVNLLRGLWTLFVIRGRWSMHFGLTPYKPLGIIHVGPIQTIHKPDGSLAIENYWYAPDYLCDQSLFTPKEGWRQLEEFSSWACQQIEKHKYRRELRQLLVQYANALSQTDPNTAFLQLWCILERITDTVGGKYDETIERVIWPYVDLLLMKEQLGHLRFRRNQYVHSAKSEDEIDQTANMARLFVETHLLRLICNNFKVESISEYGRYLSLPTNLDTLKRRREHLDQAIRMREKIAVK